MQRFAEELFVNHILLMIILGVPNCPDKKEYLPCGPPCTPLCREGNLLLPRCVPCCTPGCFCKEGYILNDNGDCVKECVPPRK